MPPNEPQLVIILLALLLPLAMMTRVLEQEIVKLTSSRVDSYTTHQLHNQPESIPFCPPLTRSPHAWTQINSSNKSDTNVTVWISKTSKLNAVCICHGAKRVWAPTLYSHMHSWAVHTYIQPATVALAAVKFRATLSHYYCTAPKCEYLVTRRTWELSPDLCLSVCLAGSPRIESTLCLWLPFETTAVKDMLRLSCKWDNNIILLSLSHMHITWDFYRVT